MTNGRSISYRPFEVALGVKAASAGAAAIAKRRGLLGGREGEPS